MSNLSAVILIHGFWGGTVHWDKVTLELKCLGHDNLHAVELPSTLLAGDAKRTHKMITQQQGPVLLIGYSYDGAMITKADSQPNMIGLVYTAAFTSDSGKSPGGIIQERLPLAAANLAPDSDGYLQAKVDGFHGSFCQDLATDEGLIMGITQEAPLASTFGDTIGSPVWKSRPSWYQISSADRMTAPGNQEQTAAQIAPRKIVTLDASHASLASRAKEVAALIGEAAVATTYQCHTGHGSRSGLLPR